MGLLTTKDIIRAEAPDDLFESLIVTPAETPEFGPSKKTKDPQIVVKWEVAGIKNSNNGIDREMKRGDVTYVIAGLTLQSTYFTLTKKALKFYEEFWAKANNKPWTKAGGCAEFAVDPEAPDLTYFKNLFMSAVVKAVMIEKTKPLTDEQKDLLQSQGKPIVGERVVDDEGNPIDIKLYQVDTWNRRFMGDVPTF